MGTPPRTPFDELLKMRARIAEDTKWGDTTYGSLVRIQALLASAEDPIATYELALECIGPIISDLEEHGADNQTLYGDHGLDHFRELQATYESDLAALRRKGVTSPFSEALAMQRSALARFREAADGATDDPAQAEEALRAFGSAPFFDATLLKEAQEALDDAVKSAIRCGKPAVAVRLAVAYLSSVKAAETPCDLINNVLVAAIRAADASAVREFLPHAEADSGYRIPNLGYGTLQYNIACAYAFLGDREALYRFAERGTWNGKNPASYIADPDFAAFAKDPAFLAALSAGEKRYQEWNAAWQEECRKNQGG